MLTDHSDVGDAVQKDQRKVTISVYQNAEHVSGILQQAFKQPLVTDESRESHADNSETTKSADEIGAKFAVDIKLPTVGGISGGANLADTSGVDQSTVRGMRSTQNFVYSQAAYLYIVRDELVRTGRLKHLTSLNDAQQVQPGDFVEYETSFKPNEIIAILDVLTPDLVAEIVSYTTRREGLTYFEVYQDFEERKLMLERLYAKADLSANLARAITHAVRTDFRSDKTREFYGTFGIGDDRVTAITICDKEHFVVSDEDRILDGVFTVLGKAISATEVEVPILGRNKILERFRPTGVDNLFEELREAAAQSNDKAKANWRGLGFDDLIDLEFSSRIPGSSFRVIPIAIYA